MHNLSRDAKSRQPKSKSGSAASSASTSKQSSVGAASSSRQQYPSQSPGRYSDVPLGMVTSRLPLPSTRDSRSRLVKRELRGLQMEALMIKEELYAADRVPPASAACKELVTYMETHADPFLPEATSTTNEALERRSKALKELKSGCFCWRPH